MRPNLSFVFVVLLALLAAGCPGQKPPVAPAPAKAAAEAPLAWHLSKSGLGFRLSNADEDADRIKEEPVAKATPLGAEEAKRIAQRLPALPTDPDAAADFAMRAKSIPAPRAGKTVPGTFPPPVQGPPTAAAATGPLTIERHAPEGPVDLAPYLTLTFSQPMVAVTSLAELSKDKPPVSLVPEPPGHWRWVGTRTVIFQPDKRFPMATDFAVEVPAGTRSLSGQALAKAERFTFTTKSPTLKDSWPRGNSESRDPLLYARFDQRIEPAAMLRSIELVSSNGPVPVRLAESDEIEVDEAVRRMSQQAEKGTWLAFKPTAKLAGATRFSVHVRAGAPSAEGPRRSEKEQLSSFSTYGPMRLARSSCSSWGGCTPLAPFQLVFSNTIDRSKFDPSLVRVTPELAGMKAEVHGSSLVVSGRTKGRTKYVVTVSEKLTDRFEQTLDKEATASFDVGSAPPALFRPERDMILLDPAAPRTLAVYSINEPALRTRIYATTPEQWAKYEAYGQDYEFPRTVLPPGKLVVDKVIHPQKAPDELVTTSIDLAAALPARYGHALVIVEPTRTIPKGQARPEIAVWVQSTDLGLDALLEADRLTGWVTRLADGAPVEGAEVAILGAPPVATDKEGLASVPLVAKGGQLLVARKGKDVVFALGNRSPDAYERRPQTDAMRWFVFDDRGIYKPGEEVRLKGWIRRSGTGRGGDIDDVPNITGTRVAYKVRDVRWAEIGSGSAVIDDKGGFDLAFKLPANANLGSAQVELSAGALELSEQSHSHRFEVQEFRRPEFEVSARTTEGPFHVGEHAIATVTASYYAGGGLPNAPVEWRVTRSTSSFTPPNRGDYHFGPPPSSFWEWRTSSKDEPKTESWTARTGGVGAHRLRVDFDAVEPSYPMSLDLLAQVEDLNHQQWAGRATMLVHPADDYVGLKLAKNFVRAGESIDADVLVSDIAGKIAPGRHVVVKAARKEWFQKGDDWEEREIDAVTCETDSSGGGEPTRCSLVAKNAGSYELSAVVTDVHGRKNRSAMRVWVTGAEVPKDKSLDREKATVVPDKREYRPGEVAEVLVVAPFVPAEGLLSVRRQGVVYRERFTMRAPTAIVKVKLEEAWVPNGEIHVDLVGAQVRSGPDGAAEPKLGTRPAFASGHAPLTLGASTRALKLKAVAKRPTLEPGGATSIDVDVRDAAGRAVAGADVAIVVADEAVLALTGKKTPDPIAVFYPPRYAGVQDIAVREHVLLGDPDLGALRPVVTEVNMRGGGIALGGAAMASAPEAAMAPPPPPAPPGLKREEPKKKAAIEAFDDATATKSGEAGKATAPIQVRKNFSPVALYVPRAKTNGEGKITVPIQLPDSLTRYRVMAVAAAGNRQFGAEESTMTARLPLMVRPSAPRFLNFGDAFEFPVVVQNQTDAPVEVGVVLRATNAAVDEPSAKRVKIAPNDRALVRFPAKTVKAGTARFQVGVSSGAYADASQVELPVYTPATTEAFATYGEIDEGAMAQPVKMPPGVFPQFGGLEISTSSTQLQALTDAMLYLVRYPYECNEQLASRVLAIAALRDVLSAFRAEGLPSAEALEASMKADFDKLKRRQNYSGGWGFWQEEPWPYLSIHVAHALVRAKDKGYKPDASMLDRAKTYLRAIDSHIPSWYGDDTRRAIQSYALFVRKKMGDADVARARKIVGDAGGVDKLPIEAVGWLWPTINEGNAPAEDAAIRRHVANRVTETAGAAHFVSGYKDGDWVLLHSDRRADGVLLESLMGADPQSTLVPKLVKGLLDHRKSGRWTNTQENAFVLLALDRYFNVYEKVTPDFVARAWLGDTFAGEHTFKGRTTERHHVDIPMSFLAERKGGQENLVIGKDGPGRLYYRVGMQYAPTNLKLPPVDAGFVVSRTYEGVDRPDDVKRAADGSWHAKIGSKVRVRVTMVAPARRHHVALVDSIPAGLEPMNPALAVTGAIPKDPKDETTRGRYWYWSRSWYEHQNLRDERVEAFTSLLWDGVWDYAYVARATTAGSFVVPPAKAEEMYAPETFGRSGGDRFVVE